MFDTGSIKISEYDVEEIEFLNEIITDLERFKIEEIQVEGHFEKSKLAWKVAILNQALIRRLCEFSNSCTLTWNSTQYVPSLTLARCIIETAAVLSDLDDSIQKCLGEEDLESIDTIIMNRTFSTRLENIFKGDKRYKAINILTLVQKLDKKLEGVFKIYENLSEIAHPNHLGHFQSFADLNTENGTVAFGKTETSQSMFSSISCAICAAGMAISAHKNLVKNVVEIAELQHRINPVKRA